MSFGNLINSRQDCLADAIAEAEDQLYAERPSSINESLHVEIPHVEENVGEVISGEGDIVCSGNTSLH